MLKRFLHVLLLLVCLIPFQAALAASDPNDAPASQDPPLFSRMPGFHIQNYEELEFDRQEFPVDASGKTQSVEGRYIFVNYYANDGIKYPSGLQVVRNYSNAIQSIGGEVVYAFEDGGTEYATLRAVKESVKVWALVESASNGMYAVKIVEEKLMNQAVTANADALAGSLNETGRAAVYGIYFDTDKAVIKPESDGAIAEVAKLLKNDGQLKLYVVGHTDNVGAFDHNVKLSQSRAAAVVEALVKKQGISAARLTPFGAGPTAPVASNKSEEGRAKNRRVELVAQ